MKPSTIELLNKYVEENSENFTTDGELLFCKVCNKSVAFDKKFLVDQHLMTREHIDKYAGSYDIDPLKDLLYKCILENSNVFETDGDVLFCKACNTLVTFGKKTLVDQHLRTQQHIENWQEISTLSNEELLSKYVSENSDVFKTDGKELFCKACEISVSFDKKVFVYQHLSNKQHIYLHKKMIRKEAKVSRTNLLEKYVSENGKVFETDGKELFCKICRKTISFDLKFSVYRHLKSKNHMQRLQNNVPAGKMQTFKSRIDRLLNIYVSDNSEVFETDGEKLFCKVCKKCISFAKKGSVHNHLQTQKHMGNFAKIKSSSTNKGLCEVKEGPSKQLPVETLNKYVSENKDVFETDGEILFCKVCKISVAYDKKLLVTQHLNTQKHKKNFAENLQKAPENVDISGKKPTHNLETNEDLCRTCMKQFSKLKQNDEKQRITETATSCGNSKSLMALLEIIQPQIKVEIKENLPTFMCSECVQKLLAAYEFIEMYQNVDKKLRKMLEEIDSNNRNNNSDRKLDILEEMEVEHDFEVTKCKIEIEEFDIDNFAQQEDEKDDEWSELEKELSEDAVNIDNDALSGGSDEEWKPEKKCGLNNVFPKQQNSDNNPKNSPKKINEIEENSRLEERVADGRLQCTQCDSVFDTVKLMRAHICQSHAENKVKRAYNRKTNDPNEKPIQKKRRIPLKPGESYQCEYCEKKYTKYRNYRIHIRLHTVEPHLCIECGKSFGRLSSFNIHMLRHKGEKTFQCPECPKSFVCSSGLYKHKMTHATNKPHVCNICGAAFHMPYQLRDHSLNHTDIKNFQCEYCDMKFVSRGKQQRHMRTHTGEKPYRCKYCERAFAQSNDCVKHLRQHLGDNVYQCDLCPLRFPLFRDLRVHFATHKDDDEETRERNLKARMEEERELQIRLSTKEPA